MQTLQNRCVICVIPKINECTKISDWSEDRLLKDKRLHETHKVHNGDSTRQVLLLKGIKPRQVNLREPHIQK
jgi:hypothetical protein